MSEFLKLGVSELSALQLFLVIFITSPQVNVKCWTMLQNGNTPSPDSYLEL